MPISERQRKCRYCFPGAFSTENVQMVCAKDNAEVNVTCDDCEKCSNFKSKYIEYPVIINGIENEPIDTFGLGIKVGNFVAIKPCDDKKTYLGIYVGDLPIFISSSLDKDKILHNRTVNNPAFFVPKLNKLVYGQESWWHKIKSADDFKEITQDDIKNQWYVQLFKELHSNNPS